MLARRISNTLEADFCVEALNEAVYKFGVPEIVNSDQGSQFTSFAWTDRLRQMGVGISMDGKGRLLDNIFVERLWRALKYECVYLHARETGSHARTGVGKWMDFYNRKRPHSALGGQPPAMVYWQTIEQHQPDQQVQSVAQFTSKSVQRSGSSSRRQPRGSPRSWAASSRCWQQCRLSVRLVAWLSVFGQVLAA